MCLRPPIIDLDVLAFDIARRAQALAESTQTDRIRIRGGGRENPDYRHRRMLRARRNRRRGRRTAKQGDELAPLHVVHGLPPAGVTTSNRRSSRDRFANFQLTTQRTAGPWADLNCSESRA